MNLEKIKEYNKHVDFVKLMVYATNKNSLSKARIDDNELVISINRELKDDKREVISKGLYFNKLLSMAFFDQSNIFYNLNYIIPKDEAIIDAEQKTKVVPYLKNLIDENFIRDKNLILFMDDDNILSINALMKSNLKYTYMVIFDYDLKTLLNKYLLNIVAFEKYIKYFFEGNMNEIDLKYNTVIHTSNNQTSFTNHYFIVINPHKEDHLFNIGLLYHELGHNILLHLVYSEKITEIFADFYDIFQRIVLKNLYGELKKENKPSTNIGKIPEIQNIREKIDSSSIGPFVKHEINYFLSLLYNSGFNVEYKTSSTLNVIFDIFVNYYSKKVISHIKNMKNKSYIQNINSPSKSYIFVGRTLETLLLTMKNVGFRHGINAFLYYTMPIELRRKAYDIFVNGFLNELKNKFSSYINNSVLEYYKRVFDNFIKPYDDNDNPFRRLKQFQLSGIAFRIANQRNESNLYFFHSLNDNSGVIKVERILSEFFNYTFNSDKSVKLPKFKTYHSLEELIRELIVYAIDFPDLEKNRTGKGFIGTHLLMDIYDIFKNDDKEENLLSELKQLRNQYWIMYYNQVLIEYVKYQFENIDNIFSEVKTIIDGFINPNREKFKLSEITDRAKYNELIEEFNNFLKQNSIKYIDNYYQFSIYHYLYLLEKMVSLQTGDFDIFSNDMDFDDNFRKYIQVIDYFAELTATLFDMDEKKFKKLLEPDSIEEEAYYIYDKYYKQYKKSYKSKNKRSNYVDLLIIALEIAYLRVIADRRVDANLFLFNSGIYLNWVFNFSF
ncbi:MAG: hypothetical protein RMJ67_01100 [Elusimicrobiota bacterium]|nr:hypothetical protein [Endomicrobiia bacterium]MDW8165100.1 hypothetical protein [Elusimicrobiota bacterium]